MSEQETEFYVTDRSSGQTTPIRVTGADEDGITFCGDCGNPIEPDQAFYNAGGRRGFVHEYPEDCPGYDPTAALDDDDDDDEDDDEDDDDDDDDEDEPTPNVKPVLIFNTGA